VGGSAIHDRFFSSVAPKSARPRKPQDAFFSRVVELTPHPKTSMRRLRNGTGNASRTIRTPTVTEQPMSNPTVRNPTGSYPTISIPTVGNPNSKHPDSEKAQYR
jgi:hypothetical protein